MVRLKTACGAARSPAATTPGEHPKHLPTVSRGACRVDSLGKALPHFIGSQIMRGSAADRPRRRCVDRRKSRSTRSYAAERQPLSTTRMTARPLDSTVFLISRTCSASPRSSLAGHVRARTPARCACLPRCSGTWQRRLVCGAPVKRDVCKGRADSPPMARALAQDTCGVGGAVDDRVGHLARLIVKAL